MFKKGARSRAVLVSPDSGALFFPFEGQRGYDVGKINGTGIDKSFFGAFPRVEAEISSSTHRTVEPPIFTVKELSLQAKALCTHILRACHPLGVTVLKQRADSWILEAQE